MPERTIAPVALVGALDTKHEEYGFVRSRLAAREVASLLVDTGVLGEPGLEADVDREAVARAGGGDLGALVAAGNRNDAMVAMASGAARMVQRLYQSGQVSGVMVLGGSNAGFVMSRLADALPIGCPKMLLSTIVAGDTRPYVQASDLTMMYPIVDIAGLNSISLPVLARAADALAGMVTAPPIPAIGTNLRSVACSMFGVTTPCVTALHDALVGNGVEVQVFHATGTGGMTLERMIRSGAFAAVADVTTTELADELLGGVCSAGPDRLSAAAACGVPQVVSTGALDMANFGPRATVPPQFAGRNLFEHNPAVTLMRTSADECARLGEIIAAKLGEATAFTEVHVPARGFSQISTPGGPFHDPEADRALVDSLRSELDSRIPLHVHDLDINDPAFAGHITEALNRALES
ncbi:MAG: Tm-1-like ATP-binding domain-containing protein [Streptosporangiales bacterium]